MRGARQTTLAFYEAPPHNLPMEVRHLRYFTAVASELHFARAAERLNIAPPTLSEQIKWLESHLGVTLFIRSTKRKVELTFAGQQFQKRALALIESFEQAERFAREAARGEVGDVKIGYVLVAATTGYIKRVIEHWPKALDAKSAKRRVTKSPLPPGPNPKTKLIGRVGQACARTECSATAQNNRAISTRLSKRRPDFITSRLAKHIDAQSPQLNCD